MKKTIDSLIVVMIFLTLFCISNSIRFGVLTHPKFLGIFFFLLLTYLFITKRLTFNKLKEKSFENYVSLGLIIFSIIITLSIVINNQISVTNIFEIIRPIVYAISLISLTSLLEDSKNRETFNKVFCSLILLLFLVNIIQFYNFGNINDLYIKKVAPTQYMTLVDNYPEPRIVGFIGNPNEYGYILAIFNLYLFYLLLVSKNKKKKIFLIILLLLNKVGLYLTGSRTAYLALIGSEFCFIFFMYFFKKDVSFISKTKCAIMACLCLTMVEATMLFVTPVKYNWRIREVFSGQIRSWEKRKQSSSKIIDNIFNDNVDVINLDDVELNSDKDDNAMKDSFDDSIGKDDIVEKNNDVQNKKLNRIIQVVIGKGPIKNGFAFDNEWIHIFVTFGVMGIISYVCIYLLSLFPLKKLTVKFKCYYVSILLLNFIYMIAAGSYFSYTLFISFILFIACVYVRENYEKK